MLLVVVIHMPDIFGKMLEDALGILFITMTALESSFIFKGWRRSSL
jgi:hypothetical protein